MNLPDSPLISTFIGIFYFLFGLAIGSFLNVCIYRMPIKMSVAKGHSICPKCNHKLGPLDLVPVLSWIFLGGKCRYCKEPISPRYWIVELMTALTYLVTYLMFGFGSESILLCLFFSMLIVLSYIDMDHGIVLDRINIAIIVLGIAAIVVPMLTKEPAFLGLSILDHVIGLFAVSVLLFVIALISVYVFKKDGMGGGDIKLYGACGFFMGWKLALLSLVMACIIGSVFGIIYMLKHSDDEEAEETTAESESTSDEDEEEGNPGFPFVPSIAIGCFLTILFGNQLINWYLNTFFKM